MINGVLTELPNGLPIPEDDGRASHLTGAFLSSMTLLSTSAVEVNLASLSGTVVIFAYPMTGVPGQPLPTDWISIPGAAGCTLETCGFRDHHEELLGLGVTVFGLSTQSNEVQLEAKKRLHLPFELISDESLALTRSMNLPSMNTNGTTMIKRITLICDDGRVSKVFYPVFPPDSHAEAVVSWIRNRNLPQ